MTTATNCKRNISSRNVGVGERSRSCGTFLSKAATVAPAKNRIPRRAGTR